MQAQKLPLVWMTLVLAGYGIPSLAENRPANTDTAGKTKAAPQMLVECTGWHALCSGSVDCQVNGTGAECACWSVNEPHIIMTGEIQDPTVKRVTEARCTDKHPCAIDEAPVCGAIRARKYVVDGVNYDWVSTFSYRGWCELYQPKACVPEEPGYIGDTQWTICDAAPCVETSSATDPERPLSCQCRVKDGPFIGTKDSCTGENGGIISAMPLEVWDFENATFTSPVPGFDHVRAACAPLRSD
jgi:hypothetical protein